MNTLLRLATVELLKPHLDTPVNVINVEHIARSRGIELASIHEPAPPAGLVGDIVEFAPNAENGESHRILGTVYADGLPRVHAHRQFQHGYGPRRPHGDHYQQGSTGCDWDCRNFLR
jgi:hypothetical protein